MSLRHRAGSLGSGSAEDRLLALPPRGGYLPNWCVSLRGCRRIGPHRIVVVAVVVVVVVVVAAVAVAGVVGVGVGVVVVGGVIIVGFVARV